MTRTHAKKTMAALCFALLCTIALPATAQIAATMPETAAETTAAEAMPDAVKAAPEPETVQKADPEIQAEKSTQSGDPKPVKPAATKPAGKVFDARTMTLENGMQVVVVENNRVPVVTQMVWYKTGAADETRGKSGIAHFMEHLMFKGSEGLKPGEFSRIIRNMGGNDNAFTAHDYTAYFQSIAANHLEKIMEMEAGRMRGMNPPPKEVDSERQVILEERRQRTDNNPQAQFGETMNAALYINHPYGIPVIGWAHEMAALSWDDAKTFYDHWYGPNNAVLVISGDVKAQEVFALANKIYGKLERADIPARQRTISPPLSGETRVEMHHKSIQQPTYQRLYRVPSYRQNKDESLALQVLEDIFGDGATSRLYKSLVIDQKLATSAGLSYDALSWDDTTVSLYAVPAPGVTMAQIEAALDAEIAKLAQDGVGEDELLDSLSRLQAEAIYARDSLTGPAMIIGYSLASGSTLDDVEYWPQNIARVTAAQIKAVAEKYLLSTSKDARYVTGHLLPETAKTTAEDEKAPAANDNGAPAAQDTPAPTQGESAAQEGKTP